jgi:hypothetical protein
MSNRSDVIAATERYEQGFDEYDDEKIRDDLVWPYMLLTLSLVVTQVAHLARGHPEQQ